MIEEGLLFKLNLVVATAAAAAAVGAQLPGDSVPWETVQVLEDSRLRAFCIIGAVAGGLISVLFMPPATVREAAFRWLGSSVCAVVFTPGLMRWYGVGFYVDYVVMVSAAIGAAAWILLRVAQDVLPARARAWLGALVPGGDGDE